MNTIIKLPNQCEYINARLVSGFRLAEPSETHKGYRVFIDVVIGNNIRHRWVHFKTKKTAMNFCSTLKKSIDAAYG